MQNVKNYKKTNISDLKYVTVRHPKTAFNLLKPKHIKNNYSINGNHSKTIFNIESVTIEHPKTYQIIKAHKTAKNYYSITKQSKTLYRVKCN